MNEKDKTIKYLQDLLAEKDKEIKRLNQLLLVDWALTPQRADGKIMTKMQVLLDWEDDTRHQVCEEIKQAFENRYNEISLNGVFARYDTLWCIDRIVAIIDQIEQGE